MSDPSALAQAVDAALDEAANLLEGKDLSELDPDIQQALGLVTSAGTSADELLDAMGVDDPDETNDDGSVDADEEGDRSAMRDNLLRAIPGSVELRDDSGAASGDGTTLAGYFSTFNTWYEIDSYWEGQFLESIAPGAFEQTIDEDLASMRCLFDHGFDMFIDCKPLGPISVLREDGTGPYYEVPLFNTSYNRDMLLPLLRGALMNGTQVGSGLGASFRFSVRNDEWDRSCKVTKDNPSGLPLRTITNAKVYEFGPVVFPANEGASAGMRSLTDTFIDRLHHDGAFASRFTERVGPKVVARMLSETSGDPRGKRGAPATKKPDGPADGRRGSTKTQRRARALLAGAMEAS